MPRMNRGKKPFVVPPLGGFPGVLPFGPPEGGTTNQFMRRIRNDASWRRIR